MSILRSHTGHKAWLGTSVGWATYRSAHIPKCGIRQSIEVPGRFIDQFDHFSDHFGDHFGIMGAERLRTDSGTIMSEVASEQGNGNE